MEGHSPGIAPTHQPVTRMFNLQTYLSMTPLSELEVAHVDQWGGMGGYLRPSGSRVLLCFHLLGWCTCQNLSSKLYSIPVSSLTIHSSNVIKLKWGGGKGLMVAARVGASLFINAKFPHFYQHSLINLPHPPLVSSSCNKEQSSMRITKE